ncbi:LysM domain/M23/M37 peptidase domain protein [Treponema primitia ZAS-2]|uniref:LysM domain/M23/M37 peptidase domain protein n=1 Tax=Treponema primitia (strain ATCC BAA-887 / DSM 12427 / ZAS-2) TaxID=545694 RepID=F5YIJ2_TREPZ|nr:M23 family metallopeptidase [Treponema primitia]AEF83917.1 LysM domain/M23/M37 peptidase domain protein [Treponema primitia ZAS-2]
MQYIIMDQHIQRRREHSGVFFPKFHAPVYRPYKYIDEIKQNPAPARRSHRNKAPGFSFFQWIPKQEKFTRPRKNTGSAFRTQDPEPKSGIKPEMQSKTKAGAKRLFSEISWLKNPFWTSPAPACVLGGIALFSALILNWQNSSVMALTPGDDPAARANLASYAGISPAITMTEDGLDFIPLDLMENFQWESYRIQNGDTISKIAADRNISMDAIIASNGISNVRRLREGETIRIPNMDGIPYTVKRGDSLSKISIVQGVPLEAILDANDIQSDTISAGMVLFIPGAKMRTEELKQALGELFIYPVRGRLSSPFGWRNDPITGVRKHHAAVDLAAGLGTTVKAAMDGRVATVGRNSNLGKYIILSHGNGLQTLYAHLNTTSVAQGSYVSQGSKIGEVGTTGYSTGPHLHFAIYKNSKAVNPLDFISL